MPILIPGVPQAAQNLGLNPVLYTETFLIAPAQVRTLNSFPVQLVPAPGENRLLLPVRSFYALPQGVVPYSGALTISLLTGAVPTSFGVGVGTGAATVITSDECLGDVEATDFAAALDAPMFLTASADRTAGDSTLTAIVTWALLDFTSVL